MDRKKLSVLITGATGFIGSHLTRKLFQEGYKVSIITRKKSKITTLKDILPFIHVYYSDLLHLSKLEKIMKSVKPNYIFHLATYPNYRSTKDIYNLVKTNIIGTLNLLMASLEINYAAFVNTGSSSEYGIKNHPMKETDSLKPISFYAATKASATFLSSVFAKIYNKPIVTFRLFSVYGPHEEEDRFIPTAIKAGVLEVPLFLTKDIVRRDFIFVDDVVDAYFSIINRSIAPGEIYNIGTGKQYSNHDIVGTLEKIIGKKIKIAKKTFKNRPWDTKTWVADISRAKNDLGWHPQFSLEKGLRTTYRWFKKTHHFYT